MMCCERDAPSDCVAFYRHAVLFFVKFIGMKGNFGEEEELNKENWGKYQYRKLSLAECYKNRKNDLPDGWVGWNVNLLWDDDHDGGDVIVTTKWTKSKRIK